MSAATKTRACPTWGWYLGVMPQTYIRTGRPETSKSSFCPLRVDVMRCVTMMLSHQQVRELSRLGEGRHRDRRRGDGERSGRWLGRALLRGGSEALDEGCVLGRGQSGLERGQDRRGVG